MTTTRYEATQRLVDICKSSHSEDEVRQKTEKLVEELGYSLQRVRIIVTIDDVIEDLVHVTVLPAEADGFSADVRFNPRS